MKTEKRIIGDRGEDIACTLLRSKSYIILERNFSSKTGEIDIIALDPKKRNIVFTEVKTRAGISYGYPFEAVNWKKRIRLIKTASYYLKIRHRSDLQPRFDIIEVINAGNGVYTRHLENVFEI